MYPIKIQNDSLQKTLDNISQIFTENLETLQINTENQKCNIITDIAGYDDLYLEKAQKQDWTQFGFPRATNFLSVQNDAEWITLLKRPVFKLQRKLCAYANALTVIYPAEGYIGWHHNGNAPGYNILFSYSLEGKGYFKYYDYKSSSVLKIKDHTGWNVKVGYYPDQTKELDRVYWHSAYTETPRLSIAFIVSDRNLWLSMIKDITYWDYDKELIEQQGPK